MRKVVTIAVLAALAALLILEAGLSLQWRMVHDAPLLAYMAYGMTHLGYSPYVDFFDMNAPGAYSFHALVGRVFGYGDLGFRIADLVWLAGLSLITWLALRRFGTRVALGAVVLFGLVYLGTGPDMSLQREFVALLPVAAAVLVATTGGGAAGAARWLLVGLLFGVAATVKPAMLVGLPAVLAFGLLDARFSEGVGARAAARSLALLALGLLFAVAVMVLALARMGSLPAFFDVARNYWPLYGALSRTHETVPEASRFAYLAGEWVRLGGRAVWLLPAVAGAFAVLCGDRLRGPDKRRVLLLAALVISYSAYPLFAGKFWTYHWLPFSYFVVALASLALADTRGWRKLAWVPPLALLVAVAIDVRPPEEFGHQLRGEEWLDPRVTRAERIAGFLEENLRPGDTVQPLDWTGGAVHAMLIARAPLATPFIYDFHFNHHVSTDYVQGLRARMLDEMTKDPPRYVIQVETMRPWVTGEDTDRRFVELDRLLAARYHKASAGFGYRVLELGAPVGPESGQNPDERATERHPSSDGRPRRAGSARQF